MRRNQSEAYNNSCNGNTKSLNSTTTCKEDEFRNLTYKVTFYKFVNSLFFLNLIFLYFTMFELFWFGFFDFC